MFTIWSPWVHGAAGPYDELINLIPLAVGGALLFYLYLVSKRRQAETPASTPPADTPPPQPGSPMIDSAHDSSASDPTR